MTRIRLLASVSDILIFVQFISLTSALSEFNAKYQMSEKSGEGFKVGTISNSLGPGFTRHSAQRYVLGTGNRHFRLNEQTSELTTAEDIDLESICKGNSNCEDDYGLIELVVNVWQGDRLLAVIKVHITIKDINDNPPIFDPPVFTKNLKEVIYVRGKKIFIPQATDSDVSKDNRELTYVLSKPSSVFSLQVFNNKPFLQLEKDLDYETQKQYILRVKAWNPLVPKTVSELKVIINVVNMNDNEPKFNQSQYTVTVSENQKPHSMIYQLHAVDKDLDLPPLVYSMLEGVDSETMKTFRVERDGRVTLSASLDFERRTSYKIPIMVADEEFLSQTMLIVKVTDINDEPPTFRLNPSRLVVEEGKDANVVVGQVIIEDKDSSEVNGDIYCEEPADKVGRQNLRFDPSPVLQPRVGKYDLYTQISFDREAVASSPNGRGVVTTLLICRDDARNGAPRLTATLTASLRITDVNDNAPKFSSQLYRASVTENNPAEMVVLTVKATDPDEGENARITYSLDRQRNFRIDPQSGEITASVIFNREIKELYKLRVFATDNGDKKKTSSASISISIEDTNDNVPELLQPNNFVISENLPANQLIGYLRARDLDAGDNGRIRFTLLHGPSSTKFRLDSNGTLFSATSFDREAQAEHCIQVQTSDMGTKKTLSSTGTVCIKIQDVNDNTPQFQHPAGPGIEVNSDDPSKNTTKPEVYLVSVYEVPGFSVLVANAIDRDSEANAQIHYRLKPTQRSGDLELFSLDSGTGEMKLARGLTRNHLGVYKVTLIAEDSGNPPNFAERTVNIMIQDVPARGNGYGFGADGRTSSIGGRNVMIVIILSSVSAFLASVLITAILCMIRPWRRRSPNGRGGPHSRGQLYMDKMASPMLAGGGGGGSMGGRMVDGGTLLKGMDPTGGLSLSSYLPGQYHHHGCQLGPEHGWPVASLQRGSTMDGKNFCIDPRMGGGMMPLPREGDLCEDQLEDDQRSNHSSTLMHKLPRGSKKNDQIRVWAYETACGSCPGPNSGTSGAPQGEEQSDSGRGGSDEELNHSTLQRQKKTSLLQTFRPTSPQHSTSSFQSPHQETSFASPKSFSGTLPRISNPGFRFNPLQQGASSTASSIPFSTLPPPGAHSTTPIMTTAITSTATNGGLPPFTAGVSPYTRLNPHTQKLLQEYNRAAPTSPVNGSAPPPLTGNSVSPMTATLGRYPPKQLRAPPGGVVLPPHAPTSASRLTGMAGQMSSGSPILTADTNGGTAGSLSEINGSSVDPEKLCNEIDQLFFKDMI